MKGIYPAIVALTLSALCSQSQTLAPKPFTITGQIDGIKSGKYILELDAFDSNPRARFIEISDGTFFLEDTTSQPLLGQLTYEDQKIFFYVDPGTTNILTGQVKPVLRANFKGSVTHDDYIKRQGKSDSIIKKDGTATLERSKRFGLDSLFVSENPTSYYSYILSNIYFHEFPMHLVERMYTLMPDSYRKTSLGKKFEERFLLRYSIEGNVRAKLDSLRLFNLKGDKSRLSLFTETSKLILVDFWSSSCIPCRENAPFMKSLFAQSSLSDLNIVSISIDIDVDKWKTALKKDGTDLWQNLMVDTVQSNTEDFWVKGIPAYFLLRSDGTTVGRFSGNENGKAKLTEAIAMELTKDLQ